MHSQNEIVSRTPALIVAEADAVGIDDVRAAMFARAASGTPFALATIAHAVGGPRPAGSQMIVDGDAITGFLSDGCIDADVALHARVVLQDHQPRHLVYGQGSPFIDVRLVCGGCIEVLIERIPPDDPAVAALERMMHQRLPAIWESDGHSRRCRADGAGQPLPAAALRHRYIPQQRLVVVGSDAFAAAIAAQGVHMGWDVLRVDPAGKQPWQVGEPTACLSLVSHFAACPADRWTAVAIATHDTDLDQAALATALRSPAGYVGVLGARQRIPERLEGLRDSGVSEPALSRLHAPIGLALGGQTPREIAVSVIAEIVAEARETKTALRLAVSSGRRK
jgi:xanthine dehydrogenase accessory factor